MTITSFYFLFLVAIGVIVYYLLPRKVQWIELLVISLVFYYYAATPYTIAYLIISTLIAYGSTMFVAELRKNDKGCKLSLFITSVALSLNILVWFAVKGRGLWEFPLKCLVSHKNIPVIESVLNTQWVAALGMGYYTLQIVGYIIDCYWENITPQKNPLKLFLFVNYFPQLITGPISRYSRLETLYTGHRFEYRNLAFGAQRILWGFFKKIVLAERVNIIVSSINSNSDIYTGFYSWLVILLYPLQMYADFSGCMDIVLGVSELFGIRLEENFRNPFFARTSQEFWQRWHITLGTWAKDYVLYPLLKSKPMIQFGKLTKKKFGKKTGKFLVNFVGMFVLWMVMGIWHGGIQFIVGVSLWYWIILMLGDLLSPILTRGTKILNIKTDCFSYHLFQSCRTYLIYAVGAAFFSMGVTGGVTLLKNAGRVLYDSNYANPWIFFDGSIVNLGVTYGDINIIIIGIIMLFIVAAFREKYGYARIWMEEQGIWFRWLVWLGLFVFVLILGMYGPGYSASEFIYQGF